jgi:DeoR family transcriptional regulator, suf operon transcriptional repressor
MKSTRERILHTLLNHPKSSINELAVSVGINAISVRHHLTSLQADGLVTAEEERHGVGRPRLVYFLTEKGMERFPTRYLDLTNRLLDLIKGSLPEQTVKDLFNQMAVDLASDYVPHAASLSFEERLNYVKDSLSKEGFSVEWVKDGEDYQIYEVACPYFQVSQNHPEVCSVDQALISKILDIPIEKVKSVLHGDHHCSYLIHAPKPAARLV